MKFLSPLFFLLLVFSGCSSDASLENISSSQTPSKKDQSSFEKVDIRDLIKQNGGNIDGVGVFEVNPETPEGLAAFLKQGGFVKTVTALDVLNGKSSEEIKTLLLQKGVSKDLLTEDILSQSLPKIEAVLAQKGVNLDMVFEDEREAMQSVLDTEAEAVRKSIDTTLKEE